MKKLIFVLLITMLVLPAKAQSPYDPTQFRPLGRFDLGDIYDFEISPDGFYIATVQVYEQPNPPTSDVSNTDEVNAEIGYTYELTLNMLDIRGGKSLWIVPLPAREWSEMQFSPTGETISVKTISPYPNEEEIRLTFYDTFTGELLSQTGDINILDAPVIPGDMAQYLSSDAEYTADGLNMVIGYWRRAESPKCGVWEVESAKLVWENPTSCGALNEDSTFMIVPQPHRNELSAYNQLTVFDVATGDIVAESSDDVLEYAWIDNFRVILHRPYGDPPVIWDVLSNTRAVIEQPYRFGTFTPFSLDDDRMYHSDPENTYVWDKSSGKLLKTLEVVGTPVQQEDRIILLQMDAG